ncbi:MAG: CPBP family intramembrane metalloprotease, partial [Eudoraea sp.]|nr:CPBP family intramembrane metalloprotease [Eudoraea sp.]
VGYAEEYIFRGLLQSLFLKKYGLRKNGVFASILLSSLFFGALHLLNLTKPEYPTAQVLIQVVYATFIGFFFGVVMLKTNKLIPVAITHALINFFFLLVFLPGLKPVQDVVDDSVSIGPIIITLPLFIIGLLIYRKLDKKEIIEKIENES